MGVKTELNIFVTDLSTRLARDRATLTNGTRHLYQDTTKVRGHTVRSFRGFGTDK